MKPSLHLALVNEVVKIGVRNGVTRRYILPRLVDGQWRVGDLPNPTLEIPIPPHRVTWIWGPR